MNADLTMEDELDLAPLDGLSEAARKAGWLATWALVATGATLFGVGLSVVMGIGTLIVAALAVVCVIALGIVVAALLLVLAGICVIGAAFALAVSALAAVGGVTLGLGALGRRAVRSLGESMGRLGRLRGRARNLPLQATSSSS